MVLKINVFLGILIVFIVLPNIVISEVIINEIQYNPKEASEDGEFLELYNTGSVEVDISDWQFTRGITYTFPQNTKIPAQGYLVLAKNPAEIQKKYGIVNILGPYEGSLDNGGETIEIVYYNGISMDLVKYNDNPPWPQAADGKGPSLELVSPVYDNNLFQNWRTSGANNEWETIEWKGIFSSEIFIMLKEAGEIELIEVRGTSSRGEFTAWIEGKGNHHIEYDYDEGKDISIIKIIASGPGNQEENYALLHIPEWLQNIEITLKTSIRLDKGSAIISYGSKNNLKTSVLKTHGTPGSRNTVYAQDPVPYIGNIDFIKENNDLYIAAIIDDLTGGRDILYAQVEFTNTGGETITRPFYDDGRFKDGVASDGIWGTKIFGNEYSNILLFKIRVRDNHNNEIIAPPANEPFPYFIYAQTTALPKINIPAYEIIINPEDFNQVMINRQKKLGVFYDGSEIYPVKINERGAKRSGGMNVKFIDRKWNEWKEVNLIPIRLAEELLAEELSYELYSLVGVPSSISYPVRIYVNGEYYGFFMLVEEVDKHFLEKHNFEKGNLYKSQSGNEHIPQYAGIGKEQIEDFIKQQYPKITNKDDDYSDLIHLIYGLDALPKRTICTFIEGQGTLCEDRELSQEDRQQIYNFFQQNFEQDALSKYLAVSTYIGHGDSYGHNHYLFHNPATNQWQIFPWDLELTWNNYFSVDNLYGAGITDWYSESTVLMENVKSHYPLIDTKATTELPTKIDEIVTQNKKELALMRAKHGSQWIFDEERSYDLINWGKTFKEKIRENHLTLE